MCQLPVSETTQNIIRTATEADPVMKELKTTIREGWPGDKDFPSRKSQGLLPILRRHDTPEWTGF